MCGVQELKASEQAVKLEYHRSKCFDLNVIVDKDCAVYKREQHLKMHGICAILWVSEQNLNLITQLGSYKHRSLFKTYGVLNQQFSRFFGLRLCF